MADSIQVPNVPDSILRPLIAGNLDFTRALQGVLGIQNSALIIAQRLGAYIEPARWQGGTLHDMTMQGTYVGTTKLNIVIEIDAAGTPDTFKASLDGGVTFPITTEPIVAGPIALTGSNGVTVTFVATTGHAVADQWVGAALPDSPTAAETPIFVGNKNAGHESSGFGSIAGQMVAAAYVSNQEINLNLVTMDDNGSNFGAGSTTIDIDAVNSGSLTRWVGNVRFQVAVAKDQTKESIAIDLQNVIAADPNIGITAAVDITNLDQINWQSKNAGTLGNLILFQTDVGTTGLTTTEVAMAGGSTDPTISLAIAAIAGSSYYYWANPYVDTTTIGSLLTEINARSGAITLKPALLFQTESLDFNTAITQANASNSGRSQSFAVEGLKAVPWEVTAAAVSQITLSGSVNGNYNFTKLPGIDIPAVTDRFTSTEEEQMITGGVTPLVSRNGVDLQILSGDSNFLRNDAGNPSSAQRKINTTRGADLVRADVVNSVSATFGQVKTNVINDLNLFVFNRMLLLQAAGIVQNVEANRDKIISAINLTNLHRIDFEVPEDILKDLDIIAFNFLVNAI